MGPIKQCCKEDSEEAFKGSSEQVFQVVPLEIGKEVSKGVSKKL